MKTIYNLLNPTEQIEKGVVEVFQMHDYSYYVVALDGKIIEEIFKTNYEDSLLEYDFLKKLLKKSKVEPEDLLFVEYDFENFACKLVNYDANNYDYKAMYNLVLQNNNISYKVLAHGVEFS